MFDRVLTVCVGNVCRSPLAEVLLRARIGARRPSFRVESAGIAALVGEPADPIAQELAYARGLDLASHRARQLTGEILAACDLVLAMEQWHVHEIEKVLPEMRGRVHTIGRFGRFDVPDPHRRPRAAFEHALALIERGIIEFEKAFWR